MSTISIPLTKGFVALVDEIDSDLTQYKWYALTTRTKDKSYAYRHKMTNYKLSRYAMHRTIMERMIGRPLLRQEHVDHINRNPLDNRRDNLRIATQRDNIRNKGAMSNCKSGFKGVTRFGEVWRAACENKHIGLFDTAIEAAIAYNHRAIEVQGEFAYFNDIPNWQDIHPMKRDGKGMRKDNTSGIKGIAIATSGRKRYIAYVNTKGKQLRVGYFYTLEEANEARNKFIKENNLWPL